MISRVTRSESYNPGLTAGAAVGLPAPSTFLGLSSPFKRASSSSKPRDFGLGVSVFSCASSSSFFFARAAERSSRKPLQTIAGRLQFLFRVVELEIGNPKAFRNREFLVHGRFQFRLLGAALGEFLLVGAFLSEAVLLFAVLRILNHPDDTADERSRSGAADKASSRAHAAVIADDRAATAADQAPVPAPTAVFDGATPE